MKLFKPQIQLVRKKNQDEADGFHLHAVTFFDKTNYRASGHEPLSGGLNDEGTFEVNLLVKLDSNIPQFESLTPIVHTLDLGILPFDDNEGAIAVNVYLDNEDTTARKKKRKVGGSQTTTTSADSDSKPMIS